MKIGLLTLVPNFNIGGILQTRALMLILKRNGHEVWLINRQRNKIPFWKLPLILTKRITLKCIFRKKISIFTEKLYSLKITALSTNTYPFISKFIQPQTFPVYSSKSMQRMHKFYAFDAYVVGSDQVWRPKFVPCIEDYFLRFADKFSGKKITYSASFGTDDWEYTPKQTSNCKKLLKNFNAVSVREHSAIAICKSRFGVDAVHTLDPTMLLTKEEYIKDFNLRDTKRCSDHIYSYLITETVEKRNVLTAIEQTLNIESFITIINESQALANANSAVISVEKWLKAFHDANFIFTDSFHGCVFSILFHKPFIVYGNTKRGLARFKSLLSTFGLNDRMITSPSDMPKNIISTSIDWTRVEQILIQQRNFSFQYLNNSLN